MLRLTVLLCGGLFIVLLIAGEDKGQVRQGLLTPPLIAQAPGPRATPKSAPIAEPAAKITEAVFVPAQPVRVEPVTPAPVVVEPAQTEPQPGNNLAIVTSRSVNVRSGPSTEDEIIGRLTNGEEVLVVADGDAPEGWSLVRIEGDGVSGYVATRLLRPVQP